MKIQLTLTKSGVQKAIDDLAAYRRSLERRLETFVDRLAAEGLSVASARFANANYAGVNDVTVYMENDGKTARICAEGGAVAFIEFGSGVQNPDYPGSAAAPYPHGSYGKGQGKRGSWVYAGSPGNAGKPVYDRKGVERPGVYRTTGNPPAEAMWSAAETMASRVRAVWLEVMAG